MSAYCPRFDDFKHRCVECNCPRRHYTPPIWASVQAEYNRQVGWATDFFNALRHPGLYQ